ncbi:MAG: HYExAFE family protein [Phycisphaeraceae bacterium]|nr:HYExAFE family protein [Phycisphaeraceae bacterium]
MTQRRHHYEVAFEDYLRSHRIPYVAVDEAKKALLPGGARLALAAAESGAAPAVKSFDFVLYGESTNLLVEIKGRRIPIRAASAPRSRRVSEGLRLHRPPSRSSLQNWVTRDDVNSLLTWERLFGSGFEAVFVFVYWCDDQPPDALFQEVFENRGKWYALRTVVVGEYARAMRTRSEKWRTVHVPSGTFEQISRPFAAPGHGASGQPDGHTDAPPYRGPVFDVPDDAVLIPHRAGTLL